MIRDRTTVLGHFACDLEFYPHIGMNLCYDFDVGIVREIRHNGDIYEVPIPGVDRYAQPPYIMPSSHVAKR